MTQPQSSTDVPLTPRPPYEEYRLYPGRGWEIWLTEHRSGWTLQVIYEDELVWESPCRWRDPDLAARVGWAWLEEEPRVLRFRTGISYRNPRLEVE